jgi:hypothetical protein
MNPVPMRMPAPVFANEHSLQVGIMETPSLLIIAH